MTVLPRIPEHIVKQVEQLCEKYIWNGHKPKIPLTVLQSSKKCGGLKLMDLRKKDISLKINWIKLLESDHKLEHMVYFNMKCPLKQRFWQCNLRVEDYHHAIPTTLDTFWKNVVEAWFRTVKKECLREDCIWYNSEIRIKKKPFFWEHAFKQGLCYIGQLYTGSSTKSCRRVNKEYGLSLMQYNSLVSAIPKYLKAKYATIEPKEIELPTIKTSQVYEDLCFNRTLLMGKHRKWEEELDLKFDFGRMLDGFRDLYLVTNVPKYRSFQYRLLNRAIITNIHLKHWGIVDENKCTFCGEHRESYLHLFIYCDFVKELWCEMDKYMNQISADPIYFDVDTVMWNRIIPANAGHIKNFICLVTKQYIYRQRCLKKDLNVHELKVIIMNLRNMERYIAIKNGKLDKHTSKWNPRKAHTTRTMESQNINANINIYVQEYLSET